MISVEMEDVLAVLQLCKPYIIGIIAALVIGIVIMIILFFPPLTLSSFSGIISCWHYYNMVIISCRFWHKMQQIWHKMPKKVHRTFLSYAWQQKAGNLVLSAFVMSESVLLYQI